MSCPDLKFDVYALAVPKTPDDHVALLHEAALFIEGMSEQLAAVQAALEAARKRAA